MKFTDLDLNGAFLIDIEPVVDERGFFARTFCSDEFEKFGLTGQFAQCSISYNKSKGTIRGMHYQEHPYEEAKIVRCVKGSIYDVIIDIRSNSPTYKKWVSIQLDAVNRREVYIPRGFAHGFQVLEDDSEVFYQISEPYRPGFDRGIRWNDPLFEINWPVEIGTISAKDRGYPNWEGSL